MAKLAHKRITALSFVALLFVSCRQSASNKVADVTNLTFAELKVAADSGDREAQFELGARFHDGKGILKDPIVAVDWWRRAAGQNLPKAQYNLGVAYGRGEGVPKDMQEAIKWCQMAADSGLPDAQQALGLMFWNGRFQDKPSYGELD